MAITMKQIRCSNDKLGETMLFGIYGGAVCNHYMATEFVEDNFYTIWTKVEPVSKQVVEDGKTYYVTEYFEALK